MGTDDEQQLTREEFERMLRSTDFATIDDVANAAGLRDLADASTPQSKPMGPTSGSGDDAPVLPTRR